MQHTTDKILDIIFTELLKLPPDMQAEIRPVAYRLVHEEFKKAVYDNVDMVRRFVSRSLSGIDGAKVERLREALEEGLARRTAVVKSPEEQEFERLLNPPPEEGFYFREKFERTAEKLVSWLTCYKDANWYARSKIFFDTDKMISFLGWYPGHTMDWIGMKSILINATIRTGMLLDALSEKKNIEICTFLGEINTAARDLADLIPFEVPGEMIDTY